MFEDESKPKVAKKSKRSFSQPRASLAKRVVIQSIYPSKIIVRGTPSGEEYVWASPGDKVGVRQEDVDKVLEKNIVRGQSACCGGSSSRTYLVVV